MNILEIILILLAFIAIMAAVVNIATNNVDGIYNKPGNCPYCGKPLEKTVIDYKVIWYCGNKECDH
jgi:hypothetical protein